MGNAPRYYDTHLIEFQKTAYVRSIEEYEELYKRSLEDIDEFWAEQARRYPDLGQGMGVCASPRCGRGTDRVVWRGGS